MKETITNETTLAAMMDVAFKMAMHSKLCSTIRDRAGTLKGDRVGSLARGFADGFMAGMAVSNFAVVGMCEVLCAVGEKRHEDMVRDAFVMAYRDVDERNAHYARAIFEHFDRRIERIENQTLRQAVEVSVPVCASMLAPWWAFGSQVRDMVGA